MTSPPCHELTACNRSDLFPAHLPFPQVTPDAVEAGLDLVDAEGVRQPHPVRGAEPVSEVGDHLVGLEEVAHEVEGLLETG